MILKTAIKVIKQYFSYGGNFCNVLDLEFKEATNVTIASVYTSLDIINTYTSDFIVISNKKQMIR